MKRVILLCMTLCMACSLALAQAPAKEKAADRKAPAKPPTLSKVLDNQFSGVEREFVSAADAMPEEKYSFAPTEGEFKDVRTFAKQVKHVATTNYMIFSAISGEKPPVDIGTGENGPDSITSKADIMEYLKGSFAFGHKALSGVTPNNATGFIKSPFGEGQTTRLAMSVLVVGHCFDHYGQMVEYLRMNGIIPPASRPQPSSGQ